MPGPWKQRERQHWRELGGIERRDAAGRIVGFVFRQRGDREEGWGWIVYSQSEVAVYDASSTPCSTSDEAMIQADKAIARQEKEGQAALAQALARLEAALED